MDKTTLKKEILSAISEELDLWFAHESSIQDGYQYESEFMKTAHQVTHIMLSKSLGTVSCNRNKKNFRPVLESMK
jgi:hypothetical protein